jgi:hypothetical protein
MPKAFGMNADLVLPASFDVESNKRKRPASCKRIIMRNRAKPFAPDWRIDRSCRRLWRAMANSKISLLDILVRFKLFSQR